MEESELLTLWRVGLTALLLGSFKIERGTALLDSKALGFLPYTSGPGVAGRGLRGGG